MSAIYRTVASYLGFYTEGAPTPVTTTADDGSVTTTLVPSPTNFVTPNVCMPITFSGWVTLGTAATTTPAVAATAPAAFSDFPLAAIDFNPPLSNFTVSKIITVKVVANPLPHDADFYAGIWGTLPVASRTHDAVARRAPNVAWVWRSNVTVQVAPEHVVPWPVGRPVADSLHAVMPGLHAPSLQIGINNGPVGTASAIPAGAVRFLVQVDCEVAGYGMMGTL